MNLLSQSPPVTLKKQQIFLNIFSKSEIKVLSSLYQAIVPHLTPTALRVPTGMFLPGSLRSPLMLIPAKTPVAVGKNTPKTLKKLSPAVYEGPVLLVNK